MLVNPFLLEYLCRRGFHTYKQLLKRNNLSWKTHKLRKTKTQLTFTHGLLVKKEAHARKKWPKINYQCQGTVETRKQDKKTNFSDY